MELLDYRSISPRSNLKVLEERYRKTGQEVTDILRQTASRRGIYECEYASNLTTMRNLLGDEFKVTVIDKKRKTRPSVLFRKRVLNKRATCVLEGANRYFIVTRKKID